MSTRSHCPPNSILPFSKLSEAKNQAKEKTASADSTALSQWKDHVLLGNCVQQMAMLPPQSVDMVFADPPYNLQLSHSLSRPDDTKVLGCGDAWDKFSSFESYDSFTQSWLLAVRRVLKPTGTLWVMGAYHNIFRVGALLQDLGFWILNDVVWIKSNPMPNFQGRRLTNAHETLIWASLGKKQKRYTFNYAALKVFNEDSQLRSDWMFPLCTGNERLKDEANSKLHPTQKPEALLYRILLSSTRKGDLVLDPFFGTGTTGAVAKKMGRHFIGIEQEAAYVEAARRRIDAVEPYAEDSLCLQMGKRLQPRIPFGHLVETGLVPAGSFLQDKRGEIQALVRLDGSLEWEGRTGSLHKIGALAQGKEGCNGWVFWHVLWEKQLCSLDMLREFYRRSQAFGGA